MVGYSIISRQFKLLITLNADTCYANCHLYMYQMQLHDCKEYGQFRQTMMGTCFLLKDPVLVNSSKLNYQRLRLSVNYCKFCFFYCIKN